MIAWTATLFAVVGLCAWAVLAERTPARTSAPGANGGNGAGAELVLSAVEVLEVRPAGGPLRLSAESAAYSLAGRNLVGTGVVVSLPGASDEFVIRARKAHWFLDEERIHLTEGVSAASNGGWAARLETARVDLDARSMASEGQAEVAGPGLRVAGKNLLWRWREGTVTLESVSSRFLPAKALRRKG